MLLIFSGHNIILNCTIYTAPTFTSLDLSVREDGGSLSVCIMGGITNETVAIQTQNKSNADSKLNKNCYNYRLKCFFSTCKPTELQKGVVWVEPDTISKHLALIACLIHIKEIDRSR